MGGLRWKGAAITATAVALILGGGLVGLLVMAPAFRTSTDPAPVPAGGHALAESATVECTINGAVFRRSLATTTCQSSAREHAAAIADRIRRVAVPTGRTAVLARKRRTRVAVADKSPQPASRGLVAPAPAAPSPAPVVPVLAPVVPPAVPPQLLDPLLRPADDGTLVDVDVVVDVDLGLGLDLGL